MKQLARSEISIRPFAPGDGDRCEQILRGLPEWFGIESATQQYIRDTAAYPTWLAWDDHNAVGFVTVRRHFPRSAEIHCIAVAPQQHRHGVGRLLVEWIERQLRADGVAFLQVKTLGPSRPCPHYTRTRLFYEALGFVALEEFLSLWPGNPALMLVKRL